MNQNEETKILQGLLDIIRGIRPHFEKTGLSCLEDCDEAIESITRLLADKPEPTKEPVCVWEQDEDGVNRTTCGHSYVFTVDGPRENGFVGCPFCLKKIQIDEVKE